MKFLSTMDEGKEKKPKSKGKDRARSRSPRKTPSTQPVVNVYTGEYSGEKGEEKCDCECEMPNILEEQDTQGIIMKLAPELYRSLLAKSYLLDLCNLNRMKREQEVCAVACDPKAYNRWACCEKPQCCPEVAAVAVPSKGMVEVREGGKLGDIGVFDDKDEVGIGGRTPGPRLYGTRQKSSGQLPGGTPTPPYRRRGPYTRGTGPGPTLGRGGGRGSGPGPTPPPRTGPGPRVYPGGGRGGGRGTGPGPGHTPIPYQLHARTTQSARNVPTEADDVINKYNYVNDRIKNLKLPVDVLFNFTESEENMDKIHEVENLKDQIDDMIQDISNNLHKKSHEDSIKSLNDLQNLINNYVN